MILPIVTYGASVLQTPCTPVAQDHPALADLLSDMWETMYAASGCGLAAPQVNRPVRLFIVDSAASYNQMEEEERRYFFEGDTGIRAAFINPELLEARVDMLWEDTEGCLSLPGLSATILRPWHIRIRYYTPDFEERTETFSGLTARMILHEYDHIEGTLYMDYLPAKERKLFLRKLNKKHKEGWKAHYPLLSIPEAST